MEIAGDKEWFLLDADGPSLCSASPVPLYYQIYQQLRRRIIAGAIPRGSVIPGEERLANQYGVSRITTNNALRQLVSEGLLQRERGVGNVVVHQAAEPTRAHLGAETFDWAAGLPGTRKLLTTAECVPPAIVASSMGLSRKTTLFFVTSILRNNGADIAYSESWLALEPGCFSQQIFEQEGLTAMLAKAGLVLQRTHQSIGASIASEPATQQLQLAMNDPVLLLTLQSVDTGGDAVEYTRHQFNPARFSLVNATH